MNNKTTALAFLGCLISGFLVGIGCAGGSTPTEAHADTIQGVPEHLVPVTLFAVENEDGSIYTWDDGLVVYYDESNGRSFLPDMIYASRDQLCEN